MGRYAVFSLTAASLLALSLVACASGNTGTGGGGGGGAGVTSSATSTGGGAPTFCKPGETHACYDGPMGTQDVGACHGGASTCAMDGSAFGPCLGEQVPTPEVCDAAKVDEDCDGKVNDEGANCVCGDGFLSNAEECDDGNTLPNDGCDASCKIERVDEIALGNSHACAVLYDGRVKCWGLGSFGQLGLGDTMTRGDDPNEMGTSLPAVSLGTGRIGVHVSLGGAHSCALLDDKTMKCWGLDTDAQLGQGDLLARGDGPSEMGDALLPIKLGTGRTVTAIGTGAKHSCAVLDDGTLKCWGRNADGQLGLGDTVTRGKAISEMGDALPAVSLGVGRKAQAVAGGLSHTCALLTDGHVKCWGLNDAGQLGLGDKISHGNGVGAMGDNLPVVDLGTNRTASQIALGYSHSCALLDDSTVKCWGANGSGQLGQGDVQNRGDVPGQLGDALAPIDLGPGKKAIAIAAAGFYSCALLDDHTLKCWGYNANGELGQGDATTRGNDPNELGAQLLPIDLGAGVLTAGVATGTSSVCAVTTTGRAKCWGDNTWGELGVGDTLTRGDMPNQLGDFLAYTHLFGNMW